MTWMAHRVSPRLARLGPPRVLGVIVAAVLLGAMVPVSAAAVRLSPGAPDYVTIDGSPGNPVANAATDTVYLPIQCQNPSSTGSCNRTASHVMDLVDSATCSAHVTANCQIIARAEAGAEPITTAIDHRSDTIYVGDAIGGGDGGGTITVINGATCNVSDTSGCATPEATIKLGGAFPAALALDPATGTLYVASPTGVVDVLDVAHCNATSTASCQAPIQAITDDQGPTGIAVDIATDTVYAADGANGVSSHTVSVIDGATCNAGESSGCGQTPASVTVGTNPQWDAIDQATDTIYVTNAYSGSISLIDGATCNGTDTSGCGQSPPTVLTGSGNEYIALDGRRHTLFALNQDNDTMSELNVRACNAQTPWRCPVEARNEQITFDPPTGGAANSFTIAAGSGTAYVVNDGGQSLALPVAIGGCDALQTSRCRVQAPSAPEAEFFPVVDGATHTIYASNATRAQIDVFDASTCRAGHLSSCTPVAEIPAVGPEANLDAIDDATHTLYAGNAATSVWPFHPGHTISVIDIAHCDAIDTSGCDAPTASINVGTYPGPPVLDTATDTLYDEYGATANRLAVINTRHCNAEDTAGCRRRLASIAVPPGAVSTALSQKTDTIYQQSLNTGKVAVIDGATCNAGNRSGCGHLAAVVSVGSSPADVVVNDATNTAYVDLGGDGDSPGAVTMIDTSACNGSNTSGCAQQLPTVPVGRQPELMALDSATGDLYVADEGSAGVSVIEGHACNATITSGCAGPVPFVPTPGSPSTLTVDPWTDTVYAADGFGGVTCCGGTGAFSVFRGRGRGR